MPTYQNLALACNDLVGPVEIQRLNRCPPTGAYSDNQQAIIALSEVVAPTFGTGIVETDDCAIFRITRLGLRTLSLVTIATGAP